MFGRRKTRDGVKEVEAKPLTVQERLSLLEADEVMLKYPSGLLQPFSRQELGRLKKRFVHMIPGEDASRELRVTLEELLQMPELRAQPFAPLVCRTVLDRQTKEAKEGDLVSFAAFVTILAVFSVKQSLEPKRQVLFDVYDHESKGCVTVDDFLRVISTVSRSNATEKKSLRQGLEMHLAPYVKQTTTGARGVLVSDFNQLVDDEEVQVTMTIVY
ncbi:hypothetical protein PRIC1_003966 [Phytophthora ramorum]